MCTFSSPSERLAQSAEILILVVRDPGPLEAWAKGERRLRVLLAVDWTESCEAAIRWVKGVRGPGPCDVVVGYVYYSGFTGDGAGRYGLPRRPPMIDHLLELAETESVDLKLDSFAQGRIATFSTPSRWWLNSS